MLRSLLFAITLAISTDVTAHTDTIIHLSPDGGLNGLPEKYSPAHFDISTWTLSIGKTQFTFPTCISDQLSAVELNEFSLTSSWYHPTWINDGEEMPRLPDYLSLSIKSQTFSVLINLATSKPIDFKSPTHADLSNEKICELLLSPNK